MNEIVFLPLSSLFLDSNNPRLSSPQESQSESIRALIIAPKQKQKLINLAEDIVEYGLNPSESLIVMPLDNKNQYVVLEGNRRLVAIKLLENPSTYKGYFSERTQAKLQSLSHKYHKSPIQMMPCVVVKDRDEGRHWIEVRHEGQQEGVGIVGWGSKEKARFRQVYGQEQIHLQVLDFLHNQGLISNEEINSVPITSIKRLIEDPDIVKRLGYSIKDGKFLPGDNNKNLALVLRQIAVDFSTRQKKVKDIYHKLDRKKYLDELLHRLGLQEISDGESQSTEGDKPQNTTSTDSDNSTQQTEGDENKKTTSKKTSQNKKRPTLIPPDITIKINHQRINDIYIELRSLKLEEFPNAVAVLFRVFLELSVDTFIPKYPEVFTRDPQDIKYGLGIKITDIANYLETTGKISRQLARTIRHYTQPDTILVSSITTFHQYVHNSSFNPSAHDLRVAWDNLQPFIMTIWE